MNTEQMHAVIDIALVFSRRTPLQNAFKLLPIPLKASTSSVCTNLCSNILTLQGRTETDIPIPRHLQGLGHGKGSQHLR